MRIKEKLCKSLGFQFLFLCVMGILVYNTFAYAENEEEWMPDPALREAVRERLIQQGIGIPENTPLTPASITRMAGLDIRAMNITSLKGLEHAVNLQTLVAYDNQIQDLRPLANLKEIHYLNLGVNQISDLSPLAGLVTLEVLGLSSNHIRDLSPLAGLTNLEDLSLGSNPISDLSPLVGLASLKKLSLNNDQITDLSPLVGLTNLEDLRVSNVTKDIFSTLPLSKWMQFGYDETCDLESVSIPERVENREHPSIFGAFGGGIILNLPELTWAEAWAHHNLVWSSLLFNFTRWVPSPEGLKHLVHIEAARKQRDDILSRNPNMIFIVAMNYQAANPGEYPEDWPYWVRDESGNRIEEEHGPILIDFTYPEIQDMEVRRAVELAKCGLFDGIFLDWWRDEWRGWEDTHYYTYDVHEAAITMLRRMREGVDAVRDDFLIIVNTNKTKVPRSAPYVNGTFMETIDGYSHTGLAEIEDTLIWAEQNLQEPRINCLEGWADKREPPDTPRNQQWMRLFTTMSLTHSDGYVNFVRGFLPTHTHLYEIEEGHSEVHARGELHSHPGNYWYPFYDAPLGRPVGGDETKGQLYENREGVFIREFTNGWAVYNRSGTEQQIEFLEAVSGVASGVAGERSHVLPDLDGEIYLKPESRLETPPTADVNGDGVVNIQDLVIVANALGKAEPDLNDDGVVNIQDLVIVANAF